MWAHELERHAAWPAGAMPPVEMPAHVDAPSPGWAWCLSDYARERGVALDPDALVLIAASGWLGLAGADEAESPLPVSTFDDPRVYLSGLRPGALDTANAALGGELVIFRQHDAAQFRWVRQRAARRQRTLVTVSARLFDPAAPKARTAVALVDDVAEAAAASAEASTADVRVLIRGGVSTARWIDADTFLEHWVSADIPMLESEWLVWVPAVQRRGAAAARAITSLALARQRLALTGQSSRGPVGAELLRDLRRNLAEDQRPGRVRAHLALLARSHSTVRDLGGVELTRRALVTGVMRLAEACDLAEPAAATMLQLTLALEACADGWRRLERLRGAGASELDAAYATLEQRERFILRALDDAAAAIEAPC